ncbi:hypothetical protein INT46_002381 [Mucor plumbeus]|uniref:Uncharacterized protein n=1 Tax=Mucor plumbeus TaxID=97098 RepID=A0A8H7QIR3_9FUNG|nr:hypothetical protein INT46_002381 [Mucor plumbeus]
MTNQTSFEIFDGKVVVLTGASRGIGKAIADELIANNAKVVIGDILEKEGQETIDAFNKKAGSKVAAFIQTDVTKYKDNQNLFKLAESEFGGVDFAVLSAGIVHNANSTFSTMDDDIEEKIIDVNTTAVIKGTKVAILHMAKRGGGAIIHVASVAGFVSSPIAPSYNASKHAIIGYTRSFTLMPNICNVRVNALCPFYVDTDLINVTSESKSEELNVYKNGINLYPRTPMSTVVDGALQLMADNSKNTETWLSLPDGNVPMEKPSFQAPFITNKTAEAVKKYYAESVIPNAKALLKEALERYDI